MKLHYLILLLLVGCGSNPPEKEYIPTGTPVVCPKYEKIESLDPLPVIWVLAKTNDGYQVLGLRGDMYSNLAINSDKTLLYIIEQNKAIGYYEKCIADHNARVRNEEGEPE